MEESRSRISTHLLPGTDMSLGEVAALLGFSTKKQLHSL